jgi:hypothetical protein
VRQLTGRENQSEFQAELDIAIFGNGIRDGAERTQRIGIKLV